MRFSPAAMTPQRPAVACRPLLAAPDCAGAVVSDASEGRLLARSLTRTGEISTGGVQAMARDVLAEWRVGAAPAGFPGRGAGGGPPRGPAPGNGGGRPPPPPPRPVLVVGVLV